MQGLFANSSVCYTARPGYTLSGDACRGIPITDHDEILRLRTRIGELELRLAVELDRAKRDRSDTARALELVRRDVDRLEGLVDGMTQAEEIAEHVADAMRKHRLRRLTLAQKVAGAVLALLVAVPAMAQVASWF